MGESLQVTLQVTLGSGEFAVQVEVVEKALHQGDGVK